MKKIVEIEQTYRYFAEVEVTEEQIKKIENGEFDGINYDHVDRNSSTDYEISWHDKDDNKRFRKVNLTSVFDMEEEVENENEIVVSLFYRCGGNFKYHFDIEMKREDLPEGVKAGSEDIEIEKFGMTPEQMYDVAGVQYDSELDHNLVDVTEIRDI